MCPPPPPQQKAQEKKWVGNADSQTYRFYSHGAVVLITSVQLHPASTHTSLLGPSCSSPLFRFGVQRDDHHPPDPSRPEGDQGSGLLCAIQGVPSGREAVLHLRWAPWLQR